ncbi:hypothetical protein LEN26_003172 [Aphanomyces euteiches]|nr:hypothetical protein LEN26_003172 [Aphanomyces euteiches]
MNSTYGELKSALTDLQHSNRSPTHETDFVRLETVLAGQQTTISNLHQSLQQHSAEQQRISQNLETLANDRASDFHRILHELQVLSRSHEETQSTTQQKLDRSELRQVELIESNRRLNEQVDALTEQQCISQNLETLANDRASDFHRILHELQVLSRSHEETQSTTQQKLDRSELRQVELIESNRRLNEQVDASNSSNPTADLTNKSTQDNSTLLHRVQTLEVACQRLSHEIHAVSKSESDTPVSTNGFDSPKSAPDSTHRLLLELQSSINAMASEMSEVKESIADSTSNQAFGPHCEFFMKQLIDQADRCQLDDPDRKMLLGLKLSSDKVHPALNQWWIALSKTKNGDVWSEIYDNFMDRFCNRTPRELVDNLFEDPEQLEGESVKAYVIRLQSILDDIDVPDHQGVVIFKRGVRHARAESCLENTDKDLCSIATA